VPKTPARGFLFWVAAHKRRKLMAVEDDPRYKHWRKSYDRVSNAQDEHIRARIMGDKDQINYTRYILDTELARHDRYVDEIFKDDLS
jgi:hypothetical protein